MVRLINHGIKHRKEPDVTIRFEFYVAILRCVRIGDQKVVPFEIYITWGFWTWEQTVEILLSTSKIERL